jgi:hypothetical protein
MAEIGIDQLTKDAFRLPSGPLALRVFRALGEYPIICSRTCKKAREVPVDGDRKHPQLPTWHHVPDLMAEVHVQCGRTVVDLGAQPPLPVHDGKLGADRADEALIYSK